MAASRRSVVVAAQQLNNNKENNDAVSLKSKVVNANNNNNNLLQKEAKATHAGPLLLQTPRKRLFGVDGESNYDDLESEESKSYEDDLMALKKSSQPVVVTNVRRSPTPHPQSKNFGLSAALKNAAPISPTLSCEGDEALSKSQDDSAANSNTSANNNNVTLTIPSNIPSRVELLAIYLQQKREWVLLLSFDRYRLRVFLCSLLLLYVSMALMTDEWCCLCCNRKKLAEKRMKKPPFHRGSVATPSFVTGTPR